MMTTNPSKPPRASATDAAILSGEDRLDNDHYTRTAIALHWIIAALITGNIALVWWSHWLAGAERQAVLNLHKSLGITVLLLALIRLLWRWLNPPPSLPPHYAAIERRTARVVHLLLYCLMFALPMTGWLRDSAWRLARENPMVLFGTIPWPRFSIIMNLEPDLKLVVHGLSGKTHMWLSYVLYAAVLLHLAGALKHQWIDREPQLQRLWRWRRVKAAKGRPE